MKRMKLFCEGMMTACVAHATAWIVLVSVDEIVHLCGHIVVVLAMQILDSLKR